MAADRTPGLGDDGINDPVEAHAPAASVRPLKAMGLVGYGLLLLALTFFAVTLVAAGFDWALTPWVVATVVCGVAGLGFLAAVRVALTRNPAHDRPQHDPLIPEVTEEEAIDYERHHHGRPESR